MRALVLMSGGMDSTIALFWALNQKSITSVSCFGVDYGQRHSNELTAAAKIADLAKNYYSQFEDIEFAYVGSVLSSKSSLLHRDIPVSTYANVEEAQKANQSDTAYIPVRNALFLSLAANRLLSKADSGMIVTGFRGRVGPGGGFPDGSPDFADAMGAALTIANYGRNVTVYDPLNRPGRSRKDALTMASHLPYCWKALAFSLTCFKGNEPPCGECLPCLRRAEGFAQFGKPDPLIERLSK